MARPSDRAIMQLLALRGEHRRECGRPEPDTFLRHRVEDAAAGGGIGVRGVAAQSH